MEEDKTTSAGMRWFKEYSARLDEGVTLSQQEGIRYLCPCCGYPTLGTRGQYDICVLCRWEDDGQDDPHADEIWGGPNYSYSLTEARRNFEKYLIMYDPARPKGRQNSLAEGTAKRALMQLFDKLKESRDESAQQELWRQVQNAEIALRAIHVPGPSDR